MKIYTLTGDDGSTSLSGGRRVPKHSARVDAYGTVDELNSWIGLLRDVSAEASTKEFLIWIQDQLMRCAVILATPDGDPVFPDQDCLGRLELSIDKMENDLPALNNFIIPGGNIYASYCHIARCVCRRTERAVLRLKQEENTPDILNKFLNRLSDYLFVLSRKMAHELGVEETPWKPRM